MANETGIEEKIDYVRYIKEHLEADLETNRQLRGEQGALECIAGQTFFVGSALADGPYKSVKPVWMATFEYAGQHELRLSETQKAILAVEKLNDGEWKEVFDYIGEYSGKAIE